MKELIRKELQENLKWVVLPALLILGPMGFLGVPPLMDDMYLFYVHLVAALFGAVLGFLQVISESRGDKRSILLHRPLSCSQIFAAKLLAGLGIYLLALGIPLASVVGLAATHGHIAQPFEWPMVLPWVADVLTGLVYYFAGMLTAQREARWYGSRCLGLAAGLFCSYLVWILPEFWQALLAIGSVGVLTLAAAWGSFCSGGAYRTQPRIARIALAATFVLGLSALSFAGRCVAGWFFWNKEGYSIHVGHQGQVLFVHEMNGKLDSIADVQGHVPEEIQGEPLDYHSLAEIMTQTAYGAWPKTRSYRNHNRAIVKYGNETMPGNQAWWYVPERGRLFGYDKQSKQLLGSFGPDGFLPADEKSGQGFEGELSYTSQLYWARVSPYLAFPGGVYAVNFRKRNVHTLYRAASGETVLWASRWVDEAKKLSVAFVGTDRSIHVLDETGNRLLSTPLIFDRTRYQLTDVGRLENPERYWAWYEPGWYCGLEAQETAPSCLVIYDRAGSEISREMVTPRPGLARTIIPRSPPPIQPSPAHAWFGPVTPPGEAAVFIGAKRYLDREVRANQGTEIPLLLQFLLTSAQLFIPGLRWLPQAHPGLMLGFGVSMFVTAAVSALVCLLLTRRYAFDRLGSLSWTLFCFLFGWMGLITLLVLPDWPARIACPKCRQFRLVTRDACEHCGAPHALPAADGTEIFESNTIAPETALSGSIR